MSKPRMPKTVMLSDSMNRHVKMLAKKWKVTPDQVLASLFSRDPVGADIDMAKLPPIEDLERWLKTIEERYYDGFENLDLCIQCLGRKRVDAVLRGGKFGATRCPRCLGTGLNIQQLVVLLLKTLAEDA